METAFTKLFFGGDSATPNPIAHAVFGFIRTAVVFLIVYILQFILDSITNQKDILAYSTWQALFIPLCVVLLEFIWRYARAINSPLAPIFKAQEVKLSHGIEQPFIPEGIDLTLPTPPKE